jgi:uncharacterized membrane protein YcaP (DUF421 family)
MKMDSVLRAIAIYVIIWMIFRIAGRRTFAELTSFDFVLLLICGEASQQALLGTDFSITNAGLVVLTLVWMDVGLSHLKQRVKSADRVMDGLPLVLVANGKLLHQRMDRERVDESDILDEARKRMGISRIDQIKYAVLERDGKISIVPMRPAIDQH